MRRAWLIVLLVQGACTCDSKVQEQTFACASNDECAPGWSCVAAVCVRDGAGGGAGGAGGAGGGAGGGSPQRCTLTDECSVDRRCVNGFCAPRLQNGELCGDGSDCTSTFCADSVCCDTDCTGACGDCNLPGLAGTCSPVALGQAGMPACAPYLCNGALRSCPTECTTAADCVSPAFCDAQRSCVTSDLPQLVQAPAITPVDGGFNPGVPLAADPGTWGSSAPGAITTSYTWQRCEADGGSCVPLTTSGQLTGTNLITDATRIAAQQGDGRPAESSTGIWDATTNLVPNGGLEVDLASWGAWTSSGTMANFPTFTRDTADRKFGAASLLATTNGAEQYQSVLAFASGVMASTPYTASAWVNAPVGATMCILFESYDAAAAYRGESQSVTFTGTGAWQRVSSSGTTPAGTTNIHLLVFTCGAMGQAISFRVDGVQFERGLIATPYVETTNGAATRPDATLTAPSGLLPIDVGWASVRARPRWTAATSRVPYPSLIHLGAPVNDKLHVFYYSAGAAWSLERNNGVQNIVRSARPATPGTPVTVTAAWNSSTLFITTDNAPFVTLAASALPTPVATVDLSRLDGEVLWMVFGRGPLTQAQSDALHALGDTDPTFAQLPPGATMLWPAATLAYTAAVGDAATYTPSAADLGFTFRLVVTATNGSGTTTHTTAPFGPVVPPPPVSVSAPGLSISSGGWYRGGVVNVSQGGWTGATSYAYRWERCDLMGGACVAATGAGATTASYTIDQTDVGGRLRAVVTATNAGGSTSRASTPSQVIVNPPPLFETSTGGVSFSAATSVSLAKPASLAEGELLLAMLTFNADPGTLTTPPGWTFAAGNLQPATGPRVAVYWATAAANEPASYSFTWTSAATGGGRLCTYSGADPAQPIAAAMVGGTVTGTRTAQIPSVTSTGPYMRHVGFVAMTTSSSFNGFLTNWSVRNATFTSNPNGGHADRLLTTAGPTGSTGWQSNAGGAVSGLESIGVSLVLRQP